ncbi:MAG: hypothetical protein AAGJ81_05755 [Verrucomicrobiota bacterium]
MSDSFTQSSLSDCTGIVLVSPIVAFLFYFSMRVAFPVAFFLLPFVLIADDDWLTELPIFDVEYYSEAHPDLQRAFRGDERELKKHWLRFGIEEGRSSSPVMDVKWYVAMNPDLQRAFGPRNYRDSLKHWIDNGLPEGRAAHPQFDPRWYIQSNPDVAAAFGARNYERAVRHYLFDGRKEGRLGALP